MAEDGPSVQPEAAVEDIEVASAKLLEGKALIDDDPDKAIELLCSTVRAFEKHYGSMAIECAPAYLYYGIALYEVARKATGALGATKATVSQPAGAETKSADAGPSDSGPSSHATEGDAQATAQEPSTKAEDASKTDASSEEIGGSDEGAIDKAECDKEGTGAVEGEGEDKGDGDEEQEDGGEEQEGEGDDVSSGDDMKLAWEMLELARVIYSRNNLEEHHSKIADVHKALGDIHAEEEQFEDAAGCYRQSITHMQAMQPPSKRRLAEVQYELSRVLTFIDEPEAAMEQTQAAITSLEGAVAEIEEQLTALPVDESGGEEAEKEARRLQGTIDDLRGVMAELQLNCEGLKETIAADGSFKEALMQAFIKATFGDAAPGGSGAAAGTSTSAPAAGTVTMSTSFTKPSNTGSAAAPVSLGVVGRGTKRICVQPTTATGTTGAGKQPLGGSGAGALAPAAGGPAKRTLADLMGGAAAPGGENVSGFGAVAVVQKPAGGGEEPQAKKARAEEVPRGEEADADAAKAAPTGASAEGGEPGGAGAETAAVQ